MELSIISSLIRIFKFYLLLFLITGIVVKNPEGLFDEKLRDRISALSKSKNRVDDERDDDLLHDSDAEEDEELEQDMEVLTALGVANLKDFSSGSGSKSSRFVEIMSRDGEAKLVKKSSVVWFLENNVQRISSDRAFRFRQLNYLGRPSHVISRVEKQVVLPGDWCIFSREDGNGFLIGYIILLAYLDGRRESVFQWEMNDETDTEEVGVLCDWYSLDMSSGKLESVPNILHGFHPCSFYIASIPTPQYAVSADGVKSHSVPIEILNSITRIV